MNAIRVGYVPLTDALPLLIARDMGFASAEGITLDLKIMGSWAQIRDSLLTGQVHAAHCLPGIPLSAQAGLYGSAPGLATAFTLNHFGNAITVDRRMIDDAVTIEQLGDRLRKLTDSALARGRPLTFASVFPVSKHEFELQYWLRTLGVTPGTELQLVVIPPPQVAEALESGRIDGFCAGEPWNSLAVSHGVGRIVSNSQALGLPGTEKVLAVQESWLQAEEHMALLRSLDRSCNWLADLANRRQAADLLATTLDIEPEIAAQALLDDVPQLDSTHRGQFVVFHGINRPDPRHAAWLLDQIQLSTGGMDALIAPDRISRRAFRQDIYDQALRGSTH